MLEDHAADFIKTWSSPGHGVYEGMELNRFVKYFTAKKILLNATSHNMSAEYAKRTL